MLSSELIRLNFVDSTGDMPRPVRIAAGPAMKTVMK